MKGWPREWRRKWLMLFSCNAIWRRLPMFILRWHSHRVRELAFNVRLRYNTYMIYIYERIRCFNRNKNETKHFSVRKSWSASESHSVHIKIIFTYTYIHSNFRFDMTPAHHTQLLYKLWFNLKMKWACSRYDRVKIFR